MLKVLINYWMESKEVVEIAIFNRKLINFGIIKAFKKAPILSSAVLQSLELPFRYVILILYKTTARKPFINKQH
jgi:hypothetical protein